MPNLRDARFPDEKPKYRQSNTSDAACAAYKLVQDLRLCYALALRHTVHGNRRVRMILVSKWAQKAKVANRSNPASKKAVIR
jgi:hypothetical protein